MYDDGLDMGKLNIDLGKRGTLDGQHPIFEDKILEKDEEDDRNVSVASAENSEKMSLHT